MTSSSWIGRAATFTQGVFRGSLGNELRGRWWRSAVTNRLAGDLGRFRAAVFFQLVEQRFEADAENFGGACFVVLGVLQSDEDKRFFGFGHGRTD